MTGLSDADFELLRNLEEALWREQTRFDPAFMEAVLADDFFEFGSSGRFHTRTGTLSRPSQPIDAVVPLVNFHVRLLAPDLAQTTYDSAVTLEGVVHHAHRSSLWSRTEAGWRLRFHQGTPFKPESALPPLP